MSDVTITPLDPSRSALLRRATLGNMNWRGDRFTIDDVVTRPEFAHYTKLVPSRGDFGVVAMGDAEEVGVSWASFLPPDDPGYGFVDASTPEISLWVAEGHRGQGLGRRLLQAMIAEAQRRGIDRLSLSVEGDNVARNLYRAAGFVDVPGRQADGVMLLDLRRAEH